MRNCTGSTVALLTKLLSRAELGNIGVTRDSHRIVQLLVSFRVVEILCASSFLRYNQCISWIICSA